MSNLSSADRVSGASSVQVVPALGGFRDRSLHDFAPSHGAAGAGHIKPGYDERLTNEDLAPLEKQTWTSYNFFAF